jgi:hypothetical protein
MTLLIAGCSLFGIGSEEEPRYTVVLKENDKEIRKYESYIVAKTTIQGSFKEAQSQGFKILAGYIFGKNTSQKKIAMTAPVVQKAESEKIAMTAPVVIKPSAPQSWTMTFSMPSSFTLDSLPTPTDPRVVLEKVEARHVAALTFSGFWSEEKNAQKALLLQEWLKSHPKYHSLGAAMFAGYNPPWTLPFLRRNEMLMEVRVAE